MQLLWQLKQPPTIGPGRRLANSAIPPLRATKNATKVPWQKNTLNLGKNGYGPLLLGIILLL